MNPDEPRLLPAGTLARRFGCTTQWLIDEHGAGRLPGVKTDRTVLFDAEIVERLLHERAQDVTPKQESLAPRSQA